MALGVFWLPSSNTITSFSQFAIQYDDTVILCGLYVHMRAHSAILLFFVLSSCETWDYGGVQVPRAPNQDSGLVIFTICDLQFSRPSLSSVWLWSIDCKYTDTEWGSICSSTGTSGYSYPNIEQYVCMWKFAYVCTRTCKHAFLPLAWPFLLWSYV